MIYTMMTMLSTSSCKLLLIKKKHKGRKNQEHFHRPSSKLYQHCIRMFIVQVGAETFRWISMSDWEKPCETSAKTSLHVLWLIWIDCFWVRERGKSYVCKDYGGHLICHKNILPIFQKTICILHVQLFSLKRSYIFPLCCVVTPW